MAENERVVDAYLKRVRDVLLADKAGAESIDATLSALREQIDDAVAGGAAPEAVIESMDRPSAFADAASPRLREGRLGLVGLISGTLCFAIGFILIPAAFPGLRGAIGNPLILLSVFLLLSLGLVSRDTHAGRAAIGLGLAIAVLIAVTLIW